MWQSYARWDTRTAVPQQLSCSAEKAILEQFKALAAKRRIAIREAGEVPVRPSQALDDTEPDRVADEGKHHGRCHPGFLECKDCGIGQSDDHVWVLRSKVRNECVQPTSNTCIGVRCGNPLCRMLTRRGCCACAASRHAAAAPPKRATVG
jgi:hypothetical protein